MNAGELNERLERAREQAAQAEPELVAAYDAALQRVGEHVAGRFLALANGHGTIGAALEAQPAPEVLPALDGPAVGFAAVVRALREGLSEIAQAVASRPATQVEAPITVQVPETVVNVPETVVHVAPANVTMPAPVIHLPEQPAPIVNVEVPEPPLRRIEFERDTRGRIEAAEEVA